MSHSLLAVISDGECLIPVPLTMGKTDQLKNNGPNCCATGIILLYCFSALTGQVEVFVAEMERACPLRKGVRF